MAAAINPQRGEQRYNAKLKAHDVQLIRALAAERAEHLKKAKELSNAIIAEKFDIKPETVDKIVNRRAWIHVPDLAQPNK